MVCQLNINRKIRHVAIHPVPLAGKMDTLGVAAKKTKDGGLMSICFVLEIGMGLLEFSQSLFGINQHKGDVTAVYRSERLNNAVFFRVSGRFAFGAVKAKRLKIYLDCQSVI